MANKNIQIEIFSENSIVILFEQILSPENLQTVLAYQRLILNNFSTEIIDTVAAYASLHITFNTLKLNVFEFKKQLQQYLIEDLQIKETEFESQIHTIPAYYGDEIGLDLQTIAQQKNLSIDEIIGTHSSITYDVYALGFLPGFAYLGNVDERIALPRLKTPRRKVNKGSIAIANQQTAIYPQDSPGGWRIIGNTPITLFDIRQEKNAKFSVGGKVKFKPISKKEFIRLGGQL